MTPNVERKENRERVGEVQVALQGNLLIWHIHIVLYTVLTYNIDVKGANREFRYCIYYDNSIDKDRPVEYTGIQKCGIGVRWHVVSRLRFSSSSRIVIAAGNTRCWCQMSSQIRWVLQFSDFPRNDIYVDKYLVIYASAIPQKYIEYKNRSIYDKSWQLTVLL